MSLRWRRSIFGVDERDVGAGVGVFLKGKAKEAVAKRVEVQAII